MVKSIMEYEGTITPSYMNSSVADHQRQSMAMQMLPLRWGRVIRVYKPDGADDSLHGSKFYQYDVMVDASSEHSVCASYVVSNCTMLSQFGGVADFSRFTPRLTDVAPSINVQKLGDGSYVCILMLNGSSHGGLIIGGVQHHNSEADDPELGHHYTQQFNGVRQEIDKDGQLTFTFKGATDAVGELLDGVDADASGSTITMTKDGSIQLFTAEEDQSIIIDHDNKKIDIVANEEWNVDCSGTTTITTSDTMELTTDANLEVNSQRDMDFKATAGKVNIKSLGLQVGLATDAFIKGTTYRSAEAIQHSALVTAMITLASAGAALASAAAAMGSAGGVMVTPVVGAVIAGPMISTAGVSLAAAGAAVSGAAGAVSAAISSFEGGAGTYLSLVNNSD